MKAFNFNLPVTCPFCNHVSIKEFLFLVPGDSSMAYIEKTRVVHCTLDKKAINTKLEGCDKDFVADIGFSTATRKIAE